MMGTRTAMARPVTSTERGSRVHAARVYARSCLLLTLAAWLGACGREGVTADVASPGNWSFTAWGEHFEAFPEVGPLTAGETAHAAAHVTRLADFSPLQEGDVELVLRGTGGEAVFRGVPSASAGIFDVEILAPAAGEYDVELRVATPEAAESLRGGRVRVGTAGSPGGVLVAPAPRGSSDGGEPLPFLKEEQWRSEFGTAWVRRGALPSSVRGLATVSPPAGGEAVVSAQVDGVLLSAGSWPFAGRRVEAGAVLFRIAPRVAQETSLPALESAVAVQANQKRLASARLERLEELLELESVSRRDVEEARARLRDLEAQVAAAEKDLAAARSSREGITASGLAVVAPIAGRVAEVVAAPGATVAAGAVLARIVRTDRLWLEVAVAARDAPRLRQDVAGVVVSGAGGESRRLEDGVELISIAPEIDEHTGTVSALLDVGGGTGLVAGSVLEAQILLRTEREGVVVPASAVIDDGGVPVVYLQLSGERFARQTVAVLDRQGDRVLVEGLIPGQRLVSAGGEAIRRSSLMGSGQAHGHVH